MGKRKKAAKKPVSGNKKKEPLATNFQCLFCNHEKAVAVRLDKKAGIGYLNCKVCGQAFQHQINYLSAAIDVYSEWIDACDAVAKDAPDSAGRTASTSFRDIDNSSRAQAAQGAGEMDDFVEDDEDAEGDFIEE